MIAALLLAALAGCSGAAEPTTVETDTPTPQAHTATKTYTPNPTLTETPLPSETQLPTDTPIPTQLETTLTYTPSTPDIWERWIHGNTTKAFWSDDGKTLYFLSYKDYRERPYIWYAYDVMSETKMESSIVAGYDDSVWERLGVADLPENYSIWPPYDYGCFSPSGEHVIYTITYSEGYLDPDNRVEFWLADTDGQRNFKFDENPFNQIIACEWLNDESKVIFYAGYATPAYTIIVDVSTGTYEILSYIYTPHGAWAILPDEKNIAMEWIVDSVRDYSIKIVSLEDGTSKVFDTEGTWPFSWSTDGRYLYYWTRSDPNLFWDPETEIRKYDLATGEISVLVKGSHLKELQKYFLRSVFVVSPSEDKIAFFGFGLRVVFLEDSSPN
jgi:hypothetical protein